MLPRIPRTAQIEIGVTSIEGRSADETRNQSDETFFDWKKSQTRARSRKSAFWRQAHVPSGQSRPGGNGVPLRKRPSRSGPRDSCSTLSRSCQSFSVFRPTDHFCCFTDLGCVPAGFTGGGAGLGAVCGAVEGTLVPPDSAS